MDNREENSRSTEQDRVANPVEETVSTTVEPALAPLGRVRDSRATGCHECVPSVLCDGKWTQPSSSLREVADCGSAVERQRFVSSRTS